MKSKWISIFLLVSMLLLTACSGQSPEAKAPAADTPYEAVPYNLFPAPDNAFVGDVMPYVTPEGCLELYYLYDTGHNGQGYHPFWKYTTDDLVGYEDNGMVLNFGTMSETDPALGTGSVMQDRDGLYHLFYTGHNDTGNNGMGKECIMHATSTDRQNWVKLPEETFFSPDGYSKDDFRDPEVFWVEEENCYWMLVAARSDETDGVTVKYTSQDLHNWTFEGNLYAPGKYYMMECPDLFRIGDTYYLLYSWECETFYSMSDSINGPFIAPENNTLDGNGFILYAGKCAELNGVPYLCAWLGRAGLSSDSGIYQWAGSVLNHQLVQKADGTLGICMPETYNAYFTEEKPFQATAKNGTVKIDGSNVSLSAERFEYALADLCTRPGTMLLECDVTLSSDSCVGFAFGGTENDPSYTALCLDGYRNLLHYEGTAVDELFKYDPEAYVYFDFSQSDTHHVQLVCENEVVALYIDGIAALTSRIGHSIDGAHIGVFVDGCEGSFQNISIKCPA